MIHNITIELSIHFKSKWHCGSGEGSLFDNRLIKRDARNRPYIPGSTLKGVFRESCEKLARTLEFPEPSDPHRMTPASFHPLSKLKSPVDKVFGTKYEGECLIFRDARLDSDIPSQYVQSQSRICKNRILGTSKEKHLFSSEYTDPILFKTTINGYHEHLVGFLEEDPPFAYCLLIAGIMMVKRIGGDKSTGKGQVEISFDSMKYNNKPVSRENIFEYLNSKDYLELIKQ